MAEGWVPPTHGVVRAYSRGCRCDECTQAYLNQESLPRKRRTDISPEELERNRQLARDHRYRQYAQRTLVRGRLVHPDPIGGHGTNTAYTSSGCRCRKCTEASKWSAGRYNAKLKPEDPSIVVDPGSAFSFGGSQ